MTRVTADCVEQSLSLLNGSSCRPCRQLGNKFRNSIDDGSVVLDRITLTRAAMLAGSASTGEIDWG
jgi:hypothetical protein